MTFVELLTFRGIRWRRNVGNPQEVSLCCPFCGDDRFRLGINPVKNIGHCFNCKWASRSHAIPAFLRKLNLTANISDAGFSDEEQPVERKVELPKDYTPLDTVDDDDELLSIPRHYLLRRGVTARQIRRHYLGVSITGRFAWRIIMPVVYRDELRGIVARDYTGRREPKYLNSTGRKSVWNCRRCKGGPLHLAEGIFKALAIEKVLGVQAGALLGHSVTEDQMEQVLEQGYTSVVLWSDPDVPGINGTIDVAERLTEGGLQVQLVFPLPREQADEMPDELLAAQAGSIYPFTQTLRWKMKLEVSER